MAFEKWPFMTIVQESTWNSFPDIYELFLWFVPLSKFFKDFAYRRVTNFMFVQWLISEQHCNSKCLFCLFFLSWFLFYMFDRPPRYVDLLRKQSDRKLTGKRVLGKEFYVCVLSIEFYTNSKSSNQKNWRLTELMVRRQNHLYNVTELKCGL